MVTPEFKNPGRPRIYNFDTLEVGGIQHIPYKKGQKDGMLDSARSLCSAHSKDGKKFKATADETGVYIKRTA